MRTARPLPALQSHKGARPGGTARTSRASRRQKGRSVHFVPELDNDAVHASDPAQLGSAVLRALLGGQLADHLPDGPLHLREAKRDSLPRKRRNHAPTALEKFLRDARLTADNDKGRLARKRELLGQTDSDAGDRLADRAESQYT